ncbi:MAG TPA: 4-hydroxythreonine-4-phosphate dehydrogenase PdxA [Terrimicrobiaceae bacterium]|nr:4-hydroxythreonine-4-phosphate dehydrogenase PdxA [Terrimicrobiaceae bacterium]
MKVGITCGDPAGIGPEIVEAALESSLLPQGVDYVVIGSSDAFAPGKPGLASAQHALEALEEAVTLARSGEIQAVVTGPVSKKWLHETGFAFPGQTEFFADRCGVNNFAMCLTGAKITVALATAHIPLVDVSRILTRSGIVRVGQLLARFLLRRGVRHPRIAVAGLNPHAGEDGDLGSEEIEIIAPAIESLHGSLNAAVEISGPHSADTVFHRVLEGEFDAVLCMYHDQGLIPLKLHAFDEGVNITLGLPFPRTSPDHGTAFEIAGKGIARPASMIAAIRLACELAAPSFAGVTSSVSA